MSPGRRTDPIRTGLNGIWIFQISKVEPHPRYTVWPEAATALQKPPMDPLALTARGAKFCAATVTTLEMDADQLVSPSMTVATWSVRSPVGKPKVGHAKCTDADSPATSSGAACDAKMAPVAASRINSVQAVAALPELVNDTETPAMSPAWTLPSGWMAVGTTAWVRAATLLNVLSSRSNALAAATGVDRWTSAANWLRPTTRLLGAMVKGKYAAASEPETAALARVAAFAAPTGIFCRSISCPFR